MIANKVIFTRYTGDPHYRTPKDVYAQLDKEFHFTFDPCPFRANEQKGLLNHWPGRVFVNPPYSEPEKWINVAINEIDLNEYCELVVMLLKADVSTKWFHELVLPNAKEIRAIKGRLSFDNKGRAPFGSMVVIFK